MKSAVKTVLIFMLLMQTVCVPQMLNRTKEFKYGQIKYSDKDKNVVDDLLLSCEKHLPSICSDINLWINMPVTVEVYHDQTEYDKHIINAEMRGSPAVSGNGKIQLVSPLAKIKIDGINYDDRLMFLVHEYVHLLIDKLDNAPPLFIDEGIASYYSSYSLYVSSAKKYIKQVGFIPTIDQLKSHYYELRAADLFSFLFVDFIVKSKGKNILTDLLRKPDAILTTALENNWKQYVRNNYY